MTIYLKANLFLLSIEKERVLKAKESKKKLSKINFLDDYTILEPISTIFLSFNFCVL